MSVRVERHAGASELLARAGEFLARKEGENNLVLGLLATMVRDPTRYPRFWLASVLDGDEVVAVGLKTAPFSAVLTRASEPAIEALVDDLSRLRDEEGPDSVPGVQSVEETAERFASAWCARHELSRTLAVSLRAFELDAVVPPPKAPGSLRLAGEADLDLLGRWLVAFHEEAVPHEPPQEGAAMARRAIASGGMHLWEDGEPVCLTSAHSPTPTGIRVGPVYTPPGKRGRGYASSCVADVSQRMLDAGHRRCFLFTDLANPTSNAIYQRIGYRPITDYTHWMFGPRST